MNRSSTSTLDEPWVAVQTKPRYERISAELLAQKGFEYFLPTYSARRRWSDRIKTLEKPLFPSYLFCRAGLGSFASVLTTSGVLRVVGCGNVPENVDDAEIAAIRSIVESGLGIRRHEYLNIGTRVRLCSGPLAGAEGLLTGKKKNYRFVVSVGLLQRSISVEVAAEWLEPQSSRPRLRDGEGNLGSRVRAA